MSDQKITAKWVSTDKSSRFTEREMRLIRNCKAYVANDPAGIPGHNLMVIISKFSDLLTGNESVENTE